jgi:hypothetical protein
MAVPERSRHDLIVGSLDEKGPSQLRCETDDPISIVGMQMIMRKPSLFDTKD